MDAIAIMDETLGVRELDSRESDGIEVTLLWDSCTLAVYIALRDRREGLQEIFPVNPADALDAFNHPFSYLPARISDAGHSVRV